MPNGRLDSVNGAGQSYQIKCDALGRTMKRILNGSATYFIYDGEKAIWEWNGSAGASNVYGIGIDEIAIRFLATDIHYFYQDHEGSVTHLTGWIGEVIESYRYDAFGAITTTSTTGVFNSRFKFTGREYAPTFGIYEYRNRAYHPGLGRFTSEDPMGFAAGDFNLFRYCGNDPIDRVDPMGLIDHFNPFLHAAWWCSSSTGSYDQYLAARAPQLFAGEGDSASGQTHTVTVQSFIAGKRAWGFDGDNRGPTSSPSEAYRTTQTATASESTGRVTIEGDTGRTHFYGRDVGKAALNQDGSKGTQTGPRSFSFSLKGSAKNPAFPGAPPIKYNFNGNVDFGRRHLQGNFKRTDFPSYQVFIDGKSVFHHRETGGPALLYHSTTDSISTGF